MLHNGDSSDREESQGVTGLDEGLTGLRDNPAGGDFLEKELGSNDFLAQPGVKAGWIYWLKKPELMSSGMIPPTPEESIPTFQGWGNEELPAHTTTMSGDAVPWHMVRRPPVQSQRVFPHLKECTYQPLRQLYRQDSMWAIQDIHCVENTRWNVKFNGQDEAAAFLERLEGISETENITKYRLLTALPELSYEKALLWYRSNKGK
ncbi:hypothetical protein JTB14_036903 [Gonioctena quinquepunctata]|nr:hypothetical protein JTB14_036903 [Gonioctena quinquepunctata]